MSTKRAISAWSPREVLKRNMGINPETVAAHEKLERELRKLGIEIRPSFDIEPPLGRSRAGVHDRNGRGEEIPALIATKGGAGAGPPATGQHRRTDA